MRQDKNFVQAKAKTEQEFYNDLCSTCNHGKICVSKKSRQGAVWFCEEFDNFVPLKTRTVSGSEFRLIPPWKNPGTVAINSAPVKGLCINCENCSTCNFTKPAGGVWHCEEYR
ncbi:MAG: hypothetical protein KAW12_16080 [Candidatus Aminicenantes bacterium]|nr:hypothetical protein [Candidatus Aminicenantes bacterium]